MKKRIFIASVGATALTVTLISCGDSIQVKQNPLPKFPGKAVLVFESIKPIDKKAELGLTLTKFKLWKTGINAEATKDGVGDVAATYGYEIWYKVEGDSGERYRSQGIEAGSTKLLADSKGNLYPPGAEPGTVFEGDSRRSDAHTKDAYDKLSPKFAGEFGLAVKLPFQTFLTSTEVVSTVAGGAFTTKSSSTKKELFDGSSEVLGGANGPLSKVVAFVPLVNSLGQVSTLEENKGYATKKKLGCLQTLAEYNADNTEVTVGRNKLIWEDAELGDKFLREGNALVTSPLPTPTPAPANDTTADQWKLYINWQNNFTMVGINATTKEIKIARQRSAPFYMGRQLPKDKSDNFDADAISEPAISGAERLIRSCNKSLNNYPIPAGGVYAETDDVTKLLAGSARIVSLTKNDDIYDLSGNPNANPATDPASFRYNPCLKATLEGYADRAATGGYTARAVLEGSAKAPRLDQGIFAVASVAALVRENGGGVYNNTNIACATGNASALTLGTNSYNWDGNVYGSVTDTAPQAKGTAGNAVAPLYYETTLGTFKL